MKYPDSDDLQDRIESIMTDYQDEDRAPSTRRTYAKAFRDFRDFCEALDEPALPADPETVAKYVLYCAEDRDLAVATLRKRLAGIRYHHRKEDHRPPTRGIIVQEAMEQVQRRKGSAQRQADPLLRSDVAQMIQAMDLSRELPEAPADRAACLRAHRDRAVITVGFAGALRRDELRRITVEDVRLSADRVRIRLPSSKTDQAGEGVTLTLSAGQTVADPVSALYTWLDVAGIDGGPVFQAVDRAGDLGDMLTGQGILRIVRRRAEDAGIQGYITGHSLRAGFATQAVLSGVDREQIMQHMRLSSIQTLMRYVRLAEEQRTDMSGALGL
jgi:site-specific recombinase XerD